MGKKREGKVGWEELIRKEREESRKEGGSREKFEKQYGEKKRGKSRLGGAEKKREGRK